MTDILCHSPTSRLVTLVGHWCRNLMAKTMLVAAFSIALCACGGGDGTTVISGLGGDVTSGSTPYASDPYTLSVSTQQLSVSVESDVARAVTQIVTVIGGTLRVAGADGATYELTVPPDALTADLTVTMTPVARFANHPFKGSASNLAYGVLLEPSGSTFLKPLNLRITPPPGVTIPISEQVPFSWNADGQSVSLAVLDPTSSQIDLKLLHFSGWAIAQYQQGLSAALSQLRDRLGGDTQSRLQSATAERAAAVRLQTATGKTDPYSITALDFENFFASYDDAVVRPLFEAAGMGCANSRLSFDTVVNAARQLEILGMPLDWTFRDTGKLKSLMAQLANVCLEVEHAKCFVKHIVQDIIPAVQAIDRQAHVLSVDGTPEWPMWRAKAEMLTSQCHSYRLEVDSTSGNQMAGPAGWTFSERMSGNVLLHLSGPVLTGEPFEIVGIGNLDASNYLMSYPGSCLKVSDVRPSGSVFNVSRLAFARGADGSLIDVKLEYFPGINASTHVTTDTCSDPPAVNTLTLFTWSNTYIVNALSQREFFDETTGPFLDHWQVNGTPTGGESLLASKSYVPTLNDAGIVYTAPTSMRLIHTPGG